MISEMRWILTRGLAFGAIALLGIIYTSCTEAERNENGEITGSGTVSATSFQVGDCFLRIESQEFADAEAVPCSEPHAIEVFAETTLPLTMTLDSLEFQNYAEDFCTDNAFGYVGTNFDFINITFDVIVPTSKSLEIGDRSVHCVFLTLDDSDLIGSLKDKGR